MPQPAESVGGLRHAGAVKPTLPGRLHAQALDAPRFDSARDVVRHLGCVQSQLHDMALWSVARRTHGLTLADLQAAFARGEFWRTHVLRPTWHFVDPDDLHWLLALTGPRVERLIRSTNRTIGLTDDVVARGVTVLLEALADGRAHTRADLATALAASGLDITGQAVAHVVMQAEVDALVVNGPMRGKQHTYRLLEPRSVPGRDDLLAQVARRYARGHGPFRDHDLAWWTSLTLTESRRAIELADLAPLDVDGVAHWRLDEPVEADVPAAWLLSNFDEYVSYAREPDDYAMFAGTVNDVMRGSGLLMVRGRLAGTWTRTVTARTVRIDVTPSAHVTKSTLRAIEQEAAAFGRFVDREPELVIGA